MHDAYLTYSVGMWLHYCLNGTPLVFVNAHIARNGIILDRKPVQVRHGMLCQVLGA
jgi:hypothetical protein